MRYFLLAIVNMYVFVCSGQQIDTVINEVGYRSYYSYELKAPAYVAYKLYQGGGNCSRSSFRFKRVGLIAEATDKDYAGSGYDKGHLANAEDFANDCTMQGRTFTYYNCLPQTPRMNRGIWKKYETRLRKLSQQDSLLIVCGGIFDSLYIGNGVAVPRYCWKIAKDLKDNKIIFCGLFPNDFSNSVVIIDDEKCIEPYLTDLFSGNIDFAAFVAVLENLGLPDKNMAQNLNIP